MGNIRLFESKKIRSAWNESEQKWYFSVADVVEALTDSTDGKQYLKRMRQRDPELNANWGTICTPVEMILFLPLTIFFPFVRYGKRGSSAIFIYTSEVSF